MDRRKWVLTSLLMLVTVLALVGPGRANGNALAQEPLSRVRFLHAVPGAPDVDVYFDGALIAPGLSYGTATPHINVPGGDRQVALRQAGTDTVLIEVPVPLVADLAFTVVIQGTPAAIEAALYEDILDELEPGMARLTAINAVGDAPPLDMLTAAGGPLLQGVSYGAQFGTVNISTGSQSLVMVPAGGAVESAVVRIGDVPLQSGTLYTFVALGTLDGTVPASALVLATPVNSGADAVRVRVAHGSPDAPAVDVYANDVLIVPSLALGQMTGHMAFPAGDYTLALRPAGSPAAEAPAASADVTLDPGVPAVTVAAQGNLGDGSLALAVYPDAVADMTPDKARVAVINTVSGSTVSVDVVDAAQTVLAADLPVGEQSQPSDVAVGEYMLVASIAGVTTPVDVVVPAQDYVGGAYYSVLVFGGGPSNAPYDARVAGTEITITPVSLLAAPPPQAVAEAATPEATAAEVTEAAPAETPPPAETVAPVEASEVVPAGDSEVVVDQPPAQEAAPPAANSELVAEPAQAPQAPPPAAPAAQPTPAPDQPVGTVELNPGANLQCREYPRSDARSLGLIPSGTTLIILGRTGEPLVPETGNPTPEPTPVVETIDDLWVSVRWDQAGGGYIRCWVAAQFLLIEYKGKFLTDIEDLFEQLPEEPFNRPGEAVGASEQPPTPVFNAVLATVTLEPGVSLQLRRYPNSNAEALDRVPSGAQLEVLGYVEAPSEGLVGQPTSPYWLRVRYRTEFGGATIGWVSAQYVVMTYFERPVVIEDLPGLDAPELDAENPEAGFYEAAGSPPTPPLESQDVVGLVNLNPGANLNLRDRPSVDARVVLGAPSGASMVLNGRNGDGAWVQVTYLSDSGPVAGWVASQYLIVTRGGQPYAIKDLPILTDEPDLMGQPVPTETPAQ